MIQRFLPALAAVSLLAGGCTSREDLKSVLNDILDALERTETRETTTNDYDIGWQTGTTIVATERAEVNVEHFRAVEGADPVAQAAIQMWPDHGELVASSGTRIAELTRNETVKYRSVIRESVPGIDQAPWRVWAYFTEAFADRAVATIEATEEFTDTTYEDTEEHTEIDLIGEFKYYIDLWSDYGSYYFEGPTTRFTVSECLAGDLNNIGSFGFDVDDIANDLSGGIYAALYLNDPSGNCGVQFYGVADAQVGEVFDYGLSSGGKVIYYVTDETAETTIEVNGAEQTVDVLVINFWFYDAAAVGDAGTSGDLIADCTEFWRTESTITTGGTSTATTSDTITHTCPIRRIQGTQWWYDNMLVRNTWTQQRIVLDGRNVYTGDIGTNTASTPAGDPTFDPGFGYEVITNCDHDNDGTNDGPCRFFDTDSEDQNVQVGLDTVDFSDPVIANDLVRYLHYVQVDQAYDFTVTAIDAAGEDTAPTDNTDTTE